MRKLITILLSVLILSTVSAKEFSWGYTTTALQEAEVEIRFEKGWNLISGFANPEWLSGGDLDNGKEFTSSNIRIIYALDPINKNYVQVFPKGDRNQFDRLPSSKVMLATGFWVYTKEAGKSEYWVPLPPKLEEVQAVKGWNFISVIPEMVDKKLNEISGSCSIEKAYSWSASSQSWVELELKSASFARGGLFHTIVVKVKESCRFGLVEESISAPPSIPN